MIAYTKTGVENFLIDKYGSRVLKYKGFKILRDLIYDNADCLAGNLVEEYARLAKTYKGNWKSIERALRYLKEMMDNNEETNLIFVNRLIIEFRSTVENA